MTTIGCRASSPSNTRRCSAGSLPLLSRFGLPLPLGGTSNHFRIGVLRALGAWDPFNVTEDADLGMRLHRAGYRVETLELHDL